MSYTARYDRTIFHNPANDYSILSMKSADTTIPAKARGTFHHRDGLIRFTVSGYGLPKTEAVELALDGDWDTTKYGVQLKVSHWEEIVPLTPEGIRGYLACGLIKGIGEKTAAEIVERFGIDALNIIENTPERLLEVRGITEARLADIVESFTQSRSMRSLMTYLSPYNVTPITAAKIQQFFGPAAAAIIRERPFELCRISGFGFMRVDEIARKTGCRPNDPMRIRGALIYILGESQGRDGHLFLPVEELCKSAYSLLNEKISPETRVEPKEVADVLCETAMSGAVTVDSGGIYLPRAYANENDTARRIAELLAQPCAVYPITAALTNAKKTLDITPSKRQEDAVRMAFRHNLSIITGSPGTGKTTVLKLVIAVFQRFKKDGKILLAAPTGRASRRMAESTGFSGAKTLHSTLGIVSGDAEDSRLNSEEPVDADLIIVDEFSMVDMWLASEFFSRVKPGTKILLVGDADQLPSVGAGNVFRELIACGMIPVTTLDRIFRQTEDSLIAHNAKFINEDNTRLYYGNDFVFDECSTQQQAAARIHSVYLQEIARRGVENVQILSPFRTDGDASANNLNAVIRETVNPYVSEENELRIGPRVFRIGDRVMQTKNKNGISNGDLGFVREIHKGGKQTAVIEFAGARVVEYDTTQLGIIELSYAMTVHKAMGSEFDVVILPILSAHNILLQRNLLYTAITRAKQRVYLIGQRKYLMIAIHKHKVDKRNTLLGQRIARCCVDQRLAAEFAEPLKATG